MALAKGDIPVPWRYRLSWALLSSEKREQKEHEWRTVWGRKKPQLYLAIVEQFKSFYYPAVPFKVLGDTCQLMVRFSSLTSRGQSDSSSPQSWPRQSSITQRTRQQQRRQVCRAPEMVKELAWRLACVRSKILHRSVVFRRS